MNATTKFNLRLLSLTCHIAEENDADEVFIQRDNKKIWPLDQKYIALKGGKVPVNVDIKDLEHNSQLSLQLWDHDTFSSNDLLGTFDFVIDEKGGPFNTDLKKKDSAFARYSIEWEAY